MFIMSRSHFDFGEKLNNFIGWSHLMMPPPDDAWLIARKNRPDVADVLISTGAPSGCYLAMVPVPSPNSAMAAVPPPSYRAAALQPSRDIVYGVCIKGSTHAFQMPNR